jgi:enoyl-CoA hydratase
MTVHDDRQGPVAVVTLDRPERRNALDLATLHALTDAIEGAVDDPSVRVLVLQGAEGHFCAGADLGGVEDEAFVQTLSVVLNGLRAARFPTVAAVEGAALGAGTQLAVACDLRVATADAQFGIPAGKLGLMVDQWTIRRMVAAFGQGAARAMFLGGEVVRGDRAHELGLVQRLGSPDLAMEWAHAIARQAPLTLAGHKVGLNEAEDLADDMSPAYRAAFERAWRSKDLQEGLAAFRERRPPDFRGE